MENNDTRGKKRNFQLNTPNCFKEYYEIYTTALNDVIDKPGVGNIGVLAPYGSGKSSFIKTFFEVYPSRCSRSINVSLASFNNESLNEKDKNSVEKSILEQIIYKRKYSWLSKSKIYVRKSKFIFPFLISLLLTAFASLLLICLMMYIKSDMPFLPPREHFWWYFGSGMLVGLVALFTIIHSIKVGKITIQNIELEFDNEKNISVLNQYIDEIIIYCEETKTKYFVFEDIDRFNCVDLLSKLREINTLINNNHNLCEKVVFIYCVKDDVFAAPEDRAKFFDFIISLTPVLNPINSRQFIDEALIINEDSNLGITEAAMAEMSQFIKEKRILNNIINDYIFYRDKLGNVETIENDKLFAMMVYKNLNLKDFSDLQSNKGTLYNFFNRHKIDAFKAASEKAHNKINEIEAQIESFSKKDAKESFEQLKQRINGIIALKGRTSASAPDKYLLCDSLASFDNNPPGYYAVVETGYVHPYTGRFQISTVFKSMTIEELIKELGDKTPFELEEEIVGSTKRKLEQQLLNLRKEYNEIKQLSANELLSRDFYRRDVVNDIQKNEFLYYAIKNSYIDESYFVFSGRKDIELDNKYIKSVLNGEKVDPNQDIQNPTLVISRLMVNRFATPSILNYSLLDTLLTEKQSAFQEKRETFIDYLTQRSDETIDFLYNYFYNGKNIPELISELRKHKYSSLVDDIAGHGEIDNVPTNVLVRGIAIHNNKKDFLSFYNQNGEIRKVIEKSNHPIEAYFIDFPSADEYIDFLLRIGQTKVEHIDDFRVIRHEAMFSIFKRIIDGNLFAFNPYNITVICTAYLHKKDITLSSFLNCKNESLKSYCLSNLSILVSNILEVSAQVTEDENTINTVLKSKDIAEDLKRVYLARISNTIDYIDGLEPDMYSLMLTSNLLKPSFASLSLVRKKGIAIDIIIDFFKSHVTSFRDKIDDIELLKEIINHKDIFAKEAEKICEYLPNKIDFTLVNDDEKRSIVIRKGYADVKVNAFLTCTGMIESIVSCLNANSECVDSLPSVITKTSEYIVLIKHQYLRNTVKRLVASKHYTRFIDQMSEEDVNAVAELLSNSQTSEKYDEPLLSKLLQASKTRVYYSKLIEVCDNSLGDKELVRIVKENDATLYEKLSSHPSVISIDMKYADSNLFFKKLEKRKIIKSYNRRKLRCNVHVDRFALLK